MGFALFVPFIPISRSQDNEIPDGVCGICKRAGREKGKTYPVLPMATRIFLPNAPEDWNEDKQRLAAAAKG